MRSLILLAALVALLSGCGGTMVFNKPGATQQDFYRDNSQCEVQGGQACNQLKGLAGVLCKRRVYKDCMQGKGWSEQKESQEQEQEQDTQEMDAALSGNAADLPGSFCDRNPSSVSCKNQKLDQKITPKTTSTNLSNRPCLSDIAECPNDTQETSNDEGEENTPLDNYAATLKSLRPLTAQGDASAQNKLGVMYDKGQGVIQDYVLAHMWFNLSASNGSENGIKDRDMVAKKMTPAQIAEAQKMARECVKKKYKNCD